MWCMAVTERIEKDPNLEAMIEHVRYEVDELMGFLTWSNTWCGVLHPNLASLTSKSLLEAALIHMRNLIEFLGRVDDRNSWQVVLARDFLSTQWSWDRNDEIEQIDQLHGRLAHMGMIRSTTNFDWQPWLNRQLPVVLSAFRDFLVVLRAQGYDGERRYLLFEQPKPEIEWVPLITVLDQLVGPRHP